ncbi:protein MICRORCHIDIA 6-like isoform X3 [Zingiber officinale]|nr:protein MICRORCHIDIA 6-like isoform X3 [Zingiber officinale]XP_042383224.1 protein MICRORCHIDIA 6-like isoform X3 [Zingiber officinale]
MKYTASSIGATYQTPSLNSCINEAMIGEVVSSTGSYAPLSGRFWSAGDYEDQPNTQSTSHRDFGNRLCVHPKFLHSNATSHKWVFGAIAELLDNAFDEVSNGATFVKIDKLSNQHSGKASLLIQDDGGGMDPILLRRCMSFGFSNKEASSSIGQYGNGFKTSTMRLGADAIVFTRCMKRSVLTQSVGLLSYTFLRQEAYNDVVVPAVDYSFDPSHGVLTKLFHNSEEQFFSNLSVLLKWSPFLTENGLLENFNDMGSHGTKIIIYNLWHNDTGETELDFETDEKDILISGAPNQVRTNSICLQKTQNHIARRLCYSLRVYCSILYLHMPDNFKIILRGCEVEHHYIARDLKYCECVKYRPHVGGKIEAEVVTTIGFLKEFPHVNVHGFNIYYMNRLILPFHHVASHRGKGVVGVLEVNYLKPTHDKQGFERSSLYEKLETRLKQMTYEYWAHHSHLVGYEKKIPGSAAHQSVAHPLHPSSGCSIMPIPVNTSTTSIDTTCMVSIPGKSIINHNASSVLGMKRRPEESIEKKESPRKQTHYSLGKDAIEETKFQSEASNSAGWQKGVDIKALIQENIEAHEECLEHERIQKELLCKVEKLKQELEQVQHHFTKLSNELIMNGSKMEACVKFESDNKFLKGFYV